MKTRRQLWWRKEKSRGKDEHIAWPEHQMMLATRIIHIYWLYGQNRRVSIVDIEEILLFNDSRPYAPYRLRRRLLRTHITRKIRGR
ncbi:hypothetical protein pdam_00013405 [Pocillopora damicornis]|uniref:Uncharacterized protein n=1 Tax=Pocillopora damicornis TaxID=46731 RepID=A0A3M6UWS3_POCDA|nr:hypothetical protein pdam_00013405 [Pocillopora damicornis]